MLQHLRNGVRLLSEWFPQQRTAEVKGKSFEVHRCTYDAALALEKVQTAVSKDFHHLAVKCTLVKTAFILHIFSPVCMATFIITIQQWFDRT